MPETRPHRDPIAEAFALLDENERRTRQDHDPIPVSSLTDPLARVVYGIAPDLADAGGTVELRDNYRGVRPWLVAKDATGSRRADISRTSGDRLRVELDPGPKSGAIFRGVDSHRAARIVLAHLDPPLERRYA